MNTARTTRTFLGLALALSCGIAGRHADADNHGRGDDHCGEQQAGDRALDEAFAAAFLANDVEAAVALYADDAVLYNIGGPPAVGPAAIRAALNGFLGAFVVKGFQHTEQHYVTEGDLSTGWALFSITVAPRGGGPEFVISGRSTTVARRIGGRWRYVHDHASLPQQ